jgi:hypothetical protein
MPKKRGISGNPKNGPEQAGGSERRGVRDSAALGRLLRLFVSLVRRHRGDELAGLFKVAFLDEDLELGQSVDREGVDERRRAAADDGRDAVAFQEALDQVSFERTVDPRNLDEVGGVAVRLASVAIFRHARSPFFAAR